MPFASTLLESYLSKYIYKSVSCLAKSKNKNILKGPFTKIFYAEKFKAFRKWEGN